MQPNPVVNLLAKAAELPGHWHPHVVGALNGQELKVVKFQGEFVWHHHADTDELFLVLAGEFDMQFRDRTVRIHQGEFIVVPQGVEHNPRADAEVTVLLLERAGTVNTGNVVNERTVQAGAL